MDDGDEFQDVFQDGLDYDQLERSAIQATQQSRAPAAHNNGSNGASISTGAVTSKIVQGPASDYGSDGDGDVIDLARGDLEEQRSRDRQAAALDEVGQREQWRQQRYAAPSKRPAAQYNGTWQQQQQQQQNVPLRSSQTSQQKLHSQTQHGRGSGQAVTRPVAHTRAAQTAQRSNGQSQADGARSHITATPTDDAVSLQARIDALESEQARLRQAAEDAKSALMSKAGEISIVRANHDRSTKEYEQKLAAIQTQHAQDMARQKAELDNARKLAEKTETDRRFLEHDLKEEVKKRVASTRATARSAVSPAVTPKKQRNRMGDGFDDNEVMLISPSRSRERLDRASPSKNGMAMKRKRAAQSAQASPSRPLPLVESADSFDEATSFNSAPRTTEIPFRPRGDDGLRNERLDFMQAILSHKYGSHKSRTIQRLTTCAFPSSSETTISSLLYDFLTKTSVTSVVGYRKGFCAVLIDTWQRCLEEKYYVPLADLVELTQMILLDAEMDLVESIMSRIVSLCLQTADLIALPTAKASGNADLHKPPSEELVSYIRPLEYIELLETLALCCSEREECLATFWSVMEFDLVLVLIHRAQPLEQKEAMLRLLSLSIVPDTFGPRTAGSKGASESPEQIQHQSDLVDRLTVMLLLEGVETGMNLRQSIPQEVLALRSQLLDLFRQMCMTRFGGRILATHRVFIGRLVRFIHESVMAMYAYDPNTHGLTTHLVNDAVRILAHLAAAHADAFDLRAKLAAVPGGAHMHLVALSKIAFAEGASVLEQGIAADVGEAAHRMLDEHLSPEEGEAVVDVFSSAKA